MRLAAGQAQQKLNRITFAGFHIKRRFK